MTAVESTVCNADARKKRELFASDEVIHGKCLGSGGFADVFEVRSFRPRDDKEDRTRSLSSIDLRHFFEEHATDESGECQYAVKCLHPELEASKQKLIAAEKDLAKEADLLNQLDHENIVKLYGYAGDDQHPNGQAGPVNSYFLILDKLDCTLDDRIARWKWQRHRQKITPVLHLLDQNYHVNRKNQLLAERLEVAYEIACALAYLHQEKIVYRDLKVTNVGFDSDGHAKLFDFGLSRKLPADSKKLVDDTYIMSTKIGSCPYMAPEVWKKKPYNEKVDVYGFALLLWEIMDLRRAFIEYAHDAAVLTEYVIIKGRRPPIRIDWPFKIQELLPKMWSVEMNERPSMQHVCIILKETIANLKGGDYKGLQKKQRKSRQIFTGVRRLVHKDTRKPVTTMN